jgi:hypothetical protein
MNRHKSFIIALISLLVSCSAARADLTWLETEVKLKPGLADETIKAEFRFENRGKTSVQILDVWRSCGCTDVKVLEQTNKAGTPDKTGKAEQTKKTEPAKKPEGAQSSERSEGSQQAEKTEQTKKPGQSDTAELAGKSEQDETSEQPEKTEYAPGEKGKVVVEISIVGYAGPLEQSVYVITDNNPETDLELIVKADIPNPVNVAPKQLYWAIGRELKPKKVLITAAEGMEIRPLQIRRRHKEIEAEYKVLEKGKTVELSIRPVETDANLLSEVTLVLEVKSGKIAVKREIDVPVLIDYERNNPKKPKPAAVTCE